MTRSLIVLLALLLITGACASRAPSASEPTPPNATPPTAAPATSGAAIVFDGLDVYTRGTARWRPR